MPTTGGEKLPIRRISALTGVNAMTLRAWERRYGLIRPLRSPKGHRLYTHQHVDLIRRVLALMERGVPISRVGEAIEAESAAQTGALAGNGPWQHYVESMAAAIARFDEPELDRIYDGALSVHSVDAVTRQVTLPLLTHLGERWQNLPGAIAEEHFFSTYLRSKLGARLQHRMRYAIGPRILAACGPGEQHEIGLLLFALEAQDAGLRTVLLGADTPLDDVAIALQRSGCDAVVLASSVDPPDGLLDRELPRLVRQAKVPVFVGGGAALRHRAAITAAGAIALGATPEDGVRLITSALTPGKPRT
jgi:MerR family transcriptional regulator, light-induced transcriptional regulator